MFRRSIFKLMDDQKWDKVRRRLSELSHDDDTESPSSSSRSLRGLDRQLSQVDMMGQTSLQRCLWTNPPLDIVETIIKHNPGLVKKTDYIDQTALHIAILGGCALEVVERLIEVYPKAALMADQNSRSPLHFAIVNGASIEIIATLCLAAPSTIKGIDADGLTPIQLAEEHKAPREILSLLQDFYVTYNRAFESTEASMERLEADGKVTVPKGGIKTKDLDNIVDHSFGWSKGKSTRFFKLDQPVKQTHQRRSSSAGAA